MQCGGVILCGGESRRMGQPKAWLDFHGETMLARVARKLSEVARPLVLVAAPGQEVPEVQPETILVRDEKQGRGPLQGIAAGLKALQGESDCAYISSCDVPFLIPAFVERMLALLGESSICVPRVGEHYHPLAAVYRTSVLPIVESLLAEDRRRPFFLFESAPTRVVQEGELTDIDPDFLTLRNLNTPEDYQAALALDWKR